MSYFFHKIEFLREIFLEHPQTEERIATIQAKIDSIKAREKAKNE